MKHSINHRMSSHRMGSNSRQRGVVLFIALIMLVAMTLAGIGLMRSVGGGVLLAGNLSLKSVTTRAADLGIETALQWLGGATAGSLAAPAAGYVNGYSPIMNGPAGYIPDAQGNFDGANQTDAWWTANGRVINPPANLSDFTVQFVVHRMCLNPNKPDDECVKLPTPEAGCGQLLGCKKSLIGWVLYRATIRVTGPKGTESIVQVMVY